jgi:hypothetical protein
VVRLRCAHAHVWRTAIPSRRNDLQNEGQNVTVLSVERWACEMVAWWNVSRMLPEEFQLCARSAEIGFRVLGLVRVV